MIEGEYKGVRKKEQKKVLFRIAPSFMERRIAKRPTGRRVRRTGRRDKNREGG